MIIFNASGHILFGIGILAGTKVFIPEAIGAEEVIYACIGSLLPDIDHKRSTLGRYNPFAGLMKHRGKTHTILGSSLLAVPFYVFGGINAVLFTLLGSIGHVFADKVYSIFPRKKPFTIKLW